MENFEVFTQCANWKNNIKEINFYKFIWFTGRQNKILIIFCHMDAVFKLLQVGSSKEGY